MAEAFGRGPGGSGASAFAPSVFKPDLLAFARQPKHRAFMGEVEAALDAFVESEKRSGELRPMTKPERAVVHEAAELYGISTASKGNEPRRYVHLYRTARTSWPAVRLTDACRVEAGAEPAPAQAAGWALPLLDVEVPRASVEQALSFLDLAFAAVILRARSDGGLPSGTIEFADEGSARRALAALGGGRRGQFRVGAPSWAAATRAAPAAPSASSAAAGPRGGQPGIAQAGRGWGRPQPSSTPQASDAGWRKLR